MEAKFEKTPEQIKKQLETYFVKYYRKSKEDFDGTEDFTLFEVLSDKKQRYFKSRIDLREREICVLLLNCGKFGQVINTTERFIKIDENFNTESLDYKDFIWHRGFRYFEFKPYINVKENGYFEKFGLIKCNDEVVFWVIPTGHPGFAFWNVTKKCAHIGSKYILKK